MVELISPAGSFESLTAAIKSGADAVYFGVEQLNMRAKSTNSFFLDDLKKISGICAAAKVKSYLTLNTIIYDHDISLMKKIMDTAKADGIDAVISHDQAVLGYSKKIRMPVHISTQANVSNIESVRFYAEYADIIVLARELTLRQVGEIVRQIRKEQITGPSGDLVKIEVFAHGALCMAISGKCYLSLHSNNSSANRGACIQNCRKSYIVTDKEEGTEFEVDNEYIMSAKDLCTIDFLDKIIKAGVSCLKIEGRGRSTEYVHTVTHCYREAIDACLAGDFTEARVAEWKAELETVFNRGFWEGYYLGRHLGEWSDSAGSKATKKKIYLGKGLKYYRNNRAGEFRLESHSLSVGDSIIITGPSTGLISTIVNEIRIDDKQVETAKKGEVITMPVAEVMRPSDRLYKLVDSE